MLLSLTNAFEKTREELYNRAKSTTSLTSSEILYQSQQLDYFITLFQNKNFSDFVVTYRVEESKLFIEIKGQLDIITSDELKSFITLNKEKWGDIKEFYIDLSHLNFFDTTGIQSIVSLITDAKSDGISIKSIITNQTAYEIFNMIGISSALKKLNCGTLVAV
jgi:anti-anti-sigma factor